MPAWSFVVRHGKRQHREGREPMFAHIVVVEMPQTHR
jgi:hypothetical protein